MEKKVAKRVDLVSIKMVREATVLYQNRTINSPGDAIELIESFLQDEDRECFLLSVWSTQEKFERTRGYLSKQVGMKKGGLAMETNTTKRYATSNLVAKVDEEVQRLLWLLLDIFLSEDLEPDYLQVFKLEVVNHKEGAMQRIIHSQEVPSMEREEGCFNVTKPYEGTVWVYLDSAGPQTMMLPEDW